MTTSEVQNTLPERSGLARLESRGGAFLLQGPVVTIVVVLVVVAAEERQDGTPGRRFRRRCPAERR